MTTKPTPADDPDIFTVHCEHGDRCGGCTLLGLPESEQVARKRKTVQAAIGRYPRLSALEVAKVVPARPNAAYRTRAKLVVAPDGGVGLYARGTHDVVDIPHCRVLSPEVARAVSAVRTLARRTPGLLFGVDVRAVQDQANTGLLVTLIGEPRARPGLEVMARELSSVHGVLGVAISERATDAPALLAGAPRVVVGAASARDRIAPDAPYHLATHGSFAQAHRGQAAAIAMRVARGLHDALGTLQGARVLELYAGSGAFGLRLCQLGARPLLVERFAPALALAQDAARAQGLSALQTRTGDAAQVAVELARAGERFDAVVVNPPRRGLPPQVRSALAALAPRALAYVSCDPETLARDLDQLALLGHAPRVLEPFDMMALSDDVECVALLRPAPSPMLAVVYEDDELIAVDKPPHLPVTPQGSGRSLLEILRAERGLPELTPVHRLDAGTSGVCLLAKRPSSVHAWSLALRDGTKEYLALARGVTHKKGSVHRPLRDGRSVREARTRYTRAEVLSGHSLLRVRPEQGRTHQIRRHLAAIGHPLLGDARYGHPPSNRHVELRYGLDRAFLHLARIELRHPRGQPLALEAELAGDLGAVVERMRKPAAG